MLKQRRNASNGITCNQTTPTTQGNQTQGNQTQGNQTQGNQTQGNQTQGNRNAKDHRAGRSNVRRRIERLENRVLPGGLLDGIVGAAVGSTLDDLDGEALSPVELEEATELASTSLAEENSGDTALGDVILEPAEEAGDIPLTTQSAELVDEVLASSAGDAEILLVSDALLTTESLLTSDLIDTFFADDDALVEIASVDITQAISTAPVTDQPLGSPVSVLDAGTGTTTTAASSTTSPADAAAGSGETFVSAGANPDDTDGSPEDVANNKLTNIVDTVEEVANSEQTGDHPRLVSTGDITRILEDGTVIKVSLECRNVPSMAGPNVIFREFGSNVDIIDPNFQAPVHQLNDAADEGVVVGTPGFDETGDFPLPVGLPGIDDSFTPWLEITSYQRWHEFRHVFSRANANPTMQYEKDHELTVMKSHSTTTTVGASVEASREINAAAELKVGTIGSKLGQGITLEGAFASSNTTALTKNITEKVLASPCQTTSVYQRVDVVRVTMKYVHYQDRGGLGWFREPNALNNVVAAPPATVTLTSYTADDNLLSPAAKGKLTVANVDVTKPN